MKTDPCNCFATNIKTVNKKKPLKVFWINNSVYRCRCRNQCCIVKKGGNASTKKRNHNVKYKLPSKLSQHDTH